MFLNLGTPRHALETVAGLGTVTHGDAVAWGIARALALGERLGVTDPAYRAEAVPVIASYGWSVDPVHPALAGQADVAARLLEAMKNDKRNARRRVRFVHQREINSNRRPEVEDADVIKVLG
jgi:3-dehydroquinate synthase